ncbi:hypothetical protein SAMN04489761_0124 [Tenacibaculum sp. MAR_2009_124]|nr:hypothetical protein SAMN04489761_0124 [Tenacibaculum sp. MAR_2009_124]
MYELEINIDVLVNYWTNGNFYFTLTIPIQEELPISN